MASLDDVGDVKEDVAAVDQRVTDLTTSVTNSASASNIQINGILDTLTSLLNGHQQLREAVGKLQEEDASLLSRINTLSDDVEKGEEARAAAAAKKKRPSKAKSPPSSSVPPPPPPPPKKTAPQAVASKPDSQGAASQADSEAAAAKARLAQQAELITAMHLAGATPEQAVDPIEQRRFIAERRAAEARKKAEMDWISQSASELILEAGVQQQAVEWLDEKQNALLKELNSCFILLHYWINDPSLPEDADDAYAAYMLKFPYQDFVGELRKKAAEAGVIIRAPCKQYFAPLTIGNSGFLDYSRIDRYIALTAIGLNVNISNSDPAYCRIRDGIYASMKAKSREQIQEERVAARAQSRQ